MKSPPIRWLLILGLLRVAGLAHAEDGCPSGLVRTGKPPPRKILSLAGR